MENTTARLEAKVAGIYALLAYKDTDLELPAPLAKALGLELIRTEDLIARRHVEANPRASWFTVSYPSTGAAGVTHHREYRTHAEAVRFAGSKRAYLTRAYGPNFAAGVVVTANATR